VSRGRQSAQGFSLVELLVAVFITLIISGAIYGLIASGETAFRREPELADRQQNIRIAMDMIQRDVELAGQGLPWFAQAFTSADNPGAGPGVCPGLLNGCTAVPGTGVMGPVAAASRGVPGGDVEPSDVLEMISIDDRCPLYSVCEPKPAADVSTAPIVTFNDPADGSVCQTPTPLTGMLMIATNNYNFAVVSARNLVAPQGSCGTVGIAAIGTPLAAPLVSWLPTPLPRLQLNLGSASVWLGQARIVRYQLAADPTDGAPSLWRSTTGLYNGLGVGVAGPPGATWQLVARGIEDLQVEYQDGVAFLANSWTNSPSIVACAAASPPALCTPAETNTITRQVRVTLSARSMAPNVQGETLPGNGQATAGPLSLVALRGQLQSVIVPRTAKVALQIP
jgi:prepilin-type N-terminal cleavage/methylation domain-containing protein